MRDFLDAFEISFSTFARCFAVERAEDFSESVSQINTEEMLLFIFMMMDDVPEEKTFFFLILNKAVLSIIFLALFI